MMALWMHHTLRLLRFLAFFLLLHSCSGIDCAADPAGQDFAIQSVNPSAGSCLGDTVVTIQAVFKMPNCSFVTGFGENLWNGLGPGGVLQTIKVDGLSCSLNGPISSDPNYQNILTCKIATMAACNSVSGDGKLVQILWNGKVSHGGYMWSWIPCWGVFGIFPHMGSVSGGTVVTVSGQHFSDIGRLQSVHNIVASITVDLYPCINVNYINATTITCLTTAAGQSTGQCQDVVVTVDTMVSSLPGAWAWIPRPVVLSVSPSHGPTQGGITVTIDGTFGTKPHDTTVFVGSSGNSTLLGCQIGSKDAHTPSRISCIVPPSQGLNHWIQVQERYFDTARMKQAEWIHSVKKYLFNYDAPSITAISPSASPPAGGDVMTINGINFGNYAPRSTNPIAITMTTSGGVTILCTNVVWDSNEIIKCTIPPGAGYNLSVSVAADGQTSTNVASFDYFPPTVISISPSTLGPTDGNGIITVSGYNFGAFPCLARPNFCYQNVLVDGEDCFQTIFVSDSILVCSVRPGIGQNHLISVDVSNQTSAQVFLMAYDPPLIESMSNETAYPGGGNILLTINGNNFGPIDPVGNPVTVRIMEDTSYIHNATYKAQPFPCVTARVKVGHHRITCLTSPGLGHNLPVIVTVGGQDSNWKYGFNHLAPQLTALVRTYSPGPPWTTYFGSPPNALLPDGSNANMTIQGLNDTFGFSGAPLDLNVAIGNKDCLKTVWIDSNTLSCIIPPGAGRNLPVWITVAGQTNMLNSLRTFTYFPPTVINVSPLSGQDNVTVHLWGSNFGVSVDDNFFIRFGGKICTQIKRYNDSYATCAAPPNLGPVTVYVSVGGWINASPFTFVNEACPLGTFADHTTMSCVPCPAGFYNDQPLSQRCQPCPHDSYQNQTQQSYCYPCPYQSAGLTVASMQLSDCQCLPGWYGPHGNDCTRCPLGGSCPGGSQVVPAFGYWGNPKYLASFFPCSPKEACPGNYTCASNAFQRLCSECPFDTFISSGMCKECPSRAATSAALAFVAVGITVTVVAIGKTRSLSDIKFIVSFTSILATMHSPTYAIPWPYFFSSFLVSMGPFLDVGTPFSWAIKCLYETHFSVLSKLILVSLVPPVGAVCLVLSFVSWSTLSGKKSGNQNEFAKSRCIRNALLFIFFSISPVCYKIASLFHCVQLDFGIYYLVADPTVRCDTDEYMTYRNGGIFLLVVYAVCVPSCMLFWLVTNRKRFNNEIFKMRYGFLYEDYKQKFFFWEGIEMVRKFFFTASIAILYGIDESIRLAIVVFVAYIYAVITFACKPYVDPRAESLQIVNVVTIYVIGLFGFVFKMNEIPKAQNILSTIFILLVTFIIAFIVAFPVSLILSALRERWNVARIHPEPTLEQHEATDQDMTSEENQRLESFLMYIKTCQRKMKRKAEAEERKQERIELLRKRAEGKALSEERRSLKDQGEISDSESDQSDDSDDSWCSDSATESESAVDSEEENEWDQFIAEQRVVDGEDVVTIVPKPTRSKRQTGHITSIRLKSLNLLKVGVRENRGRKGFVDVGAGVLIGNWAEEETKQKTKNGFFSWFRRSKDTMHHPVQNGESTKLIHQHSEHEQRADSESIEEESLSSVSMTGDNLIIQDLTEIECDPRVKRTKTVMHSSCDDPCSTETANGVKPAFRRSSRVAPVPDKPVSFYLQTLKDKRKVTLSTP